MTSDNEPWLEPLEVAIRNALYQRATTLGIVARAAYATLKNLGMIGIPDNAEFDATPMAHPAWWRGEEYGVRSAVNTMLKALTEPRHNGLFSMSEMNELREKIWTLRENQRTPGTIEVCDHNACGVPARLGPCDQLKCPLRKGAA